MMDALPYRVKRMNALANCSNFHKWIHRFCPDEWRSSLNSVLLYYSIDCCSSTNTVRQLIKLILRSIENDEEFRICVRLIELISFRCSSCRACDTRAYELDEFQFNLRHIDIFLQALIWPTTRHHDKTWHCVWCSVIRTSEHAHSI